MSGPVRPEAAGAESLARPEGWMRLAVCQDFPELPWLSDAGRVTPAERLGMVRVCRACGVRERCAAFVAREEISGGFWAGEFRDGPDPADQPDVPDRSHVPDVSSSMGQHRGGRESVAS